MDKLTSKLYSLNYEDLGKGLVIAVVGAVLAIVEKTLEAGHFDFDWQAIGKTAASACVAYLVKNFFTSQALVTPVTQVITTETTLKTGSEVSDVTSQAAE